MPLTKPDVLTLLSRLRESDVINSNHYEKEIQRQRVSEGTNELEQG